MTQIYWPKICFYFRCFMSMMMGVAIMISNMKSYESVSSGPQCSMQTLIWKSPQQINWIGYRVIFCCILLFCSFPHATKLVRIVGRNYPGGHEVWRRWSFTEGSCVSVAAAIPSRAIRKIRIGDTLHGMFFFKTLLVRVEYVSLASIYRIFS